MANLVNMQFSIRTDMSDEVKKQVQSQILLGLEAIGQEMEGYAKDECPVDLGRLRNSIAHKVVDKEDAVYVGSNVKYAPYVEFIDRYRHKVGKAHFLRDSVANHMEHYKAIMTASLDS